MTVDAIAGHELRVNLDGDSIYRTSPDGSVSCSTAPVPVTVVGYKTP
jgi:hypothetical protein